MFEHKHNLSHHTPATNNKDIAGAGTVAPSESFLGSYVAFDQLSLSIKSAISQMTTNIHRTATSRWTPRKLFLTAVVGLVIIRIVAASLNNPLASSTVTESHHVIMAPPGSEPPPWSRVRPAKTPASGGENSALTSSTSARNSTSTVALCIFGHMASMDVGGANSFKHIIKPLNTDIFVATQASKEASETALKHVQGPDANANAKLKVTNGISPKRWPLMQEYNRIGGENAKAFHKLLDMAPGSNGFSPLARDSAGLNLMFLVQKKACLTMITNEENQRDRYYDHVIIMRSNYFLVNSLPKLDTFLAIGGSTCHIPCSAKDYNGVCDSFAICTRSAAEVYLNSAQLIVNNHTQFVKALTKIVKSQKDLPLTKDGLSCLNCNTFQTDKTGTNLTRIMVNKETVLRAVLDMAHVQVVRFPDVGLDMCLCVPLGGPKRKCPDPACSWDEQLQNYLYRRIPENFSMKELVLANRKIIDACGWSKELIKFARNMPRPVPMEITLDQVKHMEKICPSSKLG